MKKNIAFFVLLLAITGMANAQTHTTPAKSTYVTTDVERQNKAIADLSGANAIAQQAAVDSVLSKPNNYNPSVLYLLSRVLYNSDYKQEACFWFYVGQLRARYDAYLCLDVTAKDLVTALNNEYGPDINAYAFSRPDTLEMTVNKVVAFVKNNEENYDHSWINLNATDAVNNSDKEIIEPKEKWPAIKKKTIDEYYNGFINYVKDKK